MKKMFKGIVFSCAALVITGALIVPSAYCGIRDCVEAQIDEGLSQTEAIGICREEAAAEREARIAELKERITAQIEKRKAFKECVEAWEYDLETVTREEIVDQVETCAIDAGLTTAEEIAEMEAKKQELIERIEAAKAKIEEAIAEAKEKKENMAACMEEARANSEDFDFEAVAAATEACLLEIGIDVDAKIQEIKDEIAQMKEACAAVQECIDQVIADEEMTTEQKKEAVSECLGIVDAE